ncbi:MAG: XRE family transcriptional regulator [Deltaproteobacteria bacterium]|nr:MAG: XRE family transcriptional regulator [Deltaproteobacteria bacterium]
MGRNHRRGPPMSRAVGPGSLEHFADNVRRAMAARGIDLGELAHRSGVREARLRRLVFGADLPELDELARLAEALGMDPSDLLGAPDGAA